MSKKLSLIGAISIGIGGMVGGGIFAVLGLAVSLAKGGTPIAFLIAGIIALITTYSYAKLSKIYIEDGGTVSFIHNHFGESIFGGSINNLLWVSYIVMLGLYSSAFGSYASQLVDITGSKDWDVHILQTAIILIALSINYLSIKFVGKIESVSVVIKVSILLAFVVIGLYGLKLNPENLEQLSPTNWESPFLLLSGGMVIFVAYEGFELIANSIGDLENREQNTAKAYYGAVGFVIILYILIAIVTVGSLPFDQIADAKDFVLAKAAEPMLGQVGFTIIALTAVVSTFSAINATVLGSYRVNYEIAKDDELPKFFCIALYGKPIGLIVTGMLSIILVNTINLESISTAGSAGFLLIFAVVNYVGFRKSAALESNRIVHLAGAILCSIALVTLLAQQMKENQLGVIVASSIILGCFALEFLYRLKVRSNSVSH